MKVELTKKQRDQLITALTAAIDATQNQMNDPVEWQRISVADWILMDGQVKYWGCLLLTVEGWA